MNNHSITHHSVAFFSRALFSAGLWALANSAPWLIHLTAGLVVLSDVYFSHLAWVRQLSANRLSIHLYILSLVFPVHSLISIDGQAPRIGRVGLVGKGSILFLFWPGTVLSFCACGYAVGLTLTPEYIYSPLTAHPRCYMNRATRYQRYTTTYTPDTYAGRYIRCACSEVQERKKRRKGNRR